MWLLGQRRVKVREFRDYINESFLPMLVKLPEFDVSSIGKHTAERWLHACGFEYGRVKKGMYVDRHNHRKTRRAATCLSFCHVPGYVGTFSFGT